ncbi:class I adenylate-forming enzyme family protein [Desulfatiferula olefinivorans]
MTQNPKLIHHFLEQSAQAYPDKTAIIYQENRITYAELNQAANRLAAYLIDNNVKKGALIPLMFENGVDYVTAYFGILKAGAVAVPLGTDLKPESLSYYLKELESDIMLASGRFERLLKATALSELGIKSLVLSNPASPQSTHGINAADFTEIIRSDGSHHNPSVSLDPEALANIIYTSGSTGTPKGVMLSHRNVVANTNSICRYLKLTDKDIQMVVLPFFYVMGQSLMNTHLAVGGTLVINNTFAYPASVIQQMIDEKVTGFSGVPSTYAYLLHKSPLEARKDELAHLRYCSQAGGHMASHLKLKLREILPSHTDIYIMYGATEASARLAYLEPDQLSRKTDSIGKAIPDVDLFVADNDGKPLPDGQIGELMAKGLNIMMGYFKDPELTSKKLGPEGYHTGDLCYRDSEGYFFLSGRQDDLIKVGGHRINPQEIEDTLMASDFIVEVALLGLPDALMGNKLVAVVVPKDETFEKSDFMHYCQKTMPRFKHPSNIVCTRSLPKKASGKIDRFKCLDLIKT